MLIFQPHSPKARGFALVATLMLMVLLGLLALGLLSLSSVSLRASSRNDAMAQAQANARLALMMAIGQLQQEMGPDSRISAAHDAGSASSGGSTHWTAVYDAWQVPEDSATAETPQGRVPTFRGWLVSGAGANAGTGEQAMLAGSRSLGSNPKPEDVIRVPMQDVTTGDQLGKIAWWTSDEGMKAKINAGSDTPVSSDPLYDSQSATKVGHQVVEELEDFEWLPTQRAKTVSTESVDLAAGLEEPGLGSVNHHITVHSVGVLADVRTGRLRRDLSNLLTRPIAELEDKPLYLYGGRMNRFEISEDGAVSNAQGIPATSGSGSNTWGINLEELSLFHNIHRQISESDGEPMLLTEATPDDLSQDRFYMYGKPSIDAMQFLLSLVAVPDGQNADGDDVYKMQMMLDGMVVLSNPNDVRLRFPPGLVKSVLLLSFPYDMKLDINGDGASRSPTFPRARRVFKGFIEGGFGGLPADGFDLEPGEAAAFGSTDATGFNLNLRRGFDPSGGVKMTSWNLQADQLKADDQIDFELLKVISARNGSNSNVYFQAWHNNNYGRIFESAVISQGPNPDGETLDSLLPEKILPPQILPVSDFIDEPKPVMLFSILKNVEQSSSQANPDALASRPLLLDESARVGRTILRYGDVPRDLQSTQLLFTAEPLNYQFRTLAAGAGGRSVYHGGGRQPGNGGNFQVVKRRIPLVPPLSLGAFENAIASGFTSHFGDSNSAWLKIGSGSDPSTTALTGMGSGSTMSPKVIGNSWTTPFVNSDQTLKVSGSFRATDDSWMANTALWDSWFLSGIVDTSDLPASNWMTDRRTAREQFMEFAENSKRLRNQRFLFHSRTSAEQTASELFDADDLKPSAINSLPKHLLIDGAFNVNSTSELAWDAFLASVRDQEILTAGGDTQEFRNPFGTLGYALDTATSGAAGDWAGLRDLTDIEISGLATAIADEVKDRGPFLSMADFLNRRPDSDNTEHRALGALQAAIDKSGLNDRFARAGRELTPDDLMTLSGAANVGEEPVPSRSNGAAGHLSQANLLTALGPQIAVRSDTFVIRTYGDVRDASDNIIAKAWCEAVVQRVPEFVDPSDSPEAMPVSTVNQLFGREFRMVSFRWLSPSEI